AHALPPFGPLARVDVVPPQEGRADAAWNAEEPHEVLLPADAPAALARSAEVGERYPGRASGSIFSSRLRRHLRRKHLVHVALHVAALEYRKPRVVVEGEGPLGVEPRRAESLAVERGLARGRPGHLAQTTQDPVALLVVAPRQ